MPRRRSLSRMALVVAVTGVVTLASPMLARAVVLPTPDTAAATAAPQDDPDTMRAFEQHRWFTAEHAVPHPRAVAVADRSGVLAVADRPGGLARVTLLDPTSDVVVGRMRVAGLDDATTLAGDGRGTLAAVSGGRLLTWSADARGVVHAKVQPIRGDVPTRTEGMAWDAGTSSWLLLDPGAERLVRLTPGDRVTATGGASLESLAGKQLRGLAFDPVSGLAYVGAPAEDGIFAVTGSGEVTTRYRLTDTPANGNFAFGPSADPTDSSRSMSLFATASGDTSTLGRVSEVSLTPLAAAAADATLAATTSTATLVRKSLLSQLSPPSPDPSGIVYQSDVDRLFVVDSEVDEMAIYRGVNMWQLARNAATVHDTGTSLKFSKEPTGVGYDPVAKRLFVSDDDKARVFELTTGPDNRFGTADDPVSSFSATAFGNDDLEDVTYDTRDGSLYLTQGVGQEVWRVRPGPNGRFDGIAPTGDDVVTHFDAAVYGLTDLEGIGYSPTRDSLFLMDRKYTQIVEVTTSGALVQKIDVTAIGMKNPAAITLGPATDDPRRTSMYVVTRGVDNDNHPDENDGTMYEVSAPDLGPVDPGTNSAPSVNAGADGTVSLESGAILDGTVTDDGLPDPPGFTTSTWSRVSGPGSVTFSDAGAEDTTATFGAPGTYVLRLTATDGDLTRADDVTLTVVSTAPVNRPPSVNAGVDQVVDLPASAELTGVVTDDGLPSPPGATAVEWSRVSGPGGVTFTAPNATSTLAAFTAPGTYVLRLSASDSALAASDDVTVVANPAPPTGNLVTNSGFEVSTTGWKGSSGTTLARVSPGHSGSWAGQLTSTATSSTTCTLNDSPDTVATTVPTTYQATAWVRGDAASVGKTVRLRIREYAGSTLVGTREVSVPLGTGWQQLTLSYLPVRAGSSELDVNLLRSSTPGGAVCFQADDITVSSTTQPPVNQVPTVVAGADQAVTLPGSASLAGIVTDDGLPNPPGATSVQWSQVSGPAPVVFDDPGARATTARFSQAGSYQLRLTADDSALSASDVLTVTVTDPAGPPPVTNLVANPGFETDTTGWKGSSGTTLSRTSPGHTGSWAALLVNSGTSSTTCALNDSPDSAASTVAGTYTARAWVRGDAAGAGTVLRLRVREYAGQVNAGSGESSVTLTTGWQQVTLAYPVTSPGSHLDVNLLRSTPAGSTCFAADDLELLAP